MAEPQSSASQSKYAAEAGEHCLFLGVCDDPSIHFGFATPANCCHSTERPHSIEASYQASTCLGTGWTECPRYRAAIDPEAAQDSEVAAVRPLARHRPPVWAVLGAIAVVALVVAGLILVLTRSGGGEGPVPSPTPAPTESTQVLASDPSPSPTASPTSSSTPTTTATATATPEPPTETATAPPATDTRLAPTDMATPRPSTDTPVPPTESPVPPTNTPVPTPSSTPVPSPRPTRPRPTPTDVRFPAPVLLSPQNRHVFLEADEVVLAWLPVGPLPANVFYVPTVSYSHEGATWNDETPWTQNTRWTLSEHRYLLDMSDDGLFFWTVQVMRKTGEDANGRPVGRPVSPMSEERFFSWTHGSGGRPAPTTTSEPVPTRTKEPPPP
jgi:hypothetical protein